VTLSLSLLPQAIFKPNLFPEEYPNISQTYSFYTYPPVKMEQIECSETSAYKIQTPVNYPEESTQHVNTYLLLCQGNLHCLMPWCSTEHLDEFMQIYNVRQSENTEQKMHDLHTIRPLRS
jgi:hypothetical protein